MDCTFILVLQVGSKMDKIKAKEISLASGNRSSENFF